MFKQLCKTLFQKSKMFSTTYKNVQNGFATMATDVEAERIVWMDLEMTGLDVNRCYIMEAAALITDAELNIIAEGPDIVIHQPSEILDNMDAWCIKQHGKTGLTEASRTSTISLQEAEKTMLNFLYKHIQPGLSPLAGSSIYMDRMFLKKYMPEVENYLHYRLIDVSTIKELCRRWNHEVYSKVPKKEFLHRSLNDIKESVAELRYYRENFMKITT